MPCFIIKGCEATDVACAGKNKMSKAYQKSSKRFSGLETVIYHPFSSITGYLHFITDFLHLTGFYFLKGLRCFIFVLSINH